ncbi:MAG: tautomerase family protein [Actinomycetota bacterium]
MPLYRCSGPEGALSPDQRSAVAEAITDIHCSETTAPPTFVHVQFHDAPGDQATPFAVHGGLRAGRPDDVTERIIKRTTEAVADIAGVAVDEVSMRTSETPASWIYEGGRVLPEPGDEAAWLADH